jgi:hypothetical protein
MRRPLTRPTVLGPSGWAAAAARGLPVGLPVARPADVARACPPDHGCCAKRPTENHWMVIVGYDVSDPLNPKWKVKNSW